MQKAWKPIGPTLRRLLRRFLLLRGDGQRAWKPIGVTLLILAIGIVLFDLVTFRYDDIIYYWKASSFTIGHLPQINIVTDEDRLLSYHVDHIALPRNYFPHPGSNLPYTEFTCEYPPFVWPFLILPHIMGSDIFVYDLAFIGEMILLHLLAIAMLQRVTRRLGIEPMSRWQTTAFFSVFTATVSVVVLRRFDVVSATIVAGALLAYASKRPVLTGVLLGLGAAAKLWPGMLVPFFVLPALADRRWREVLQIGLTSVVLFLLAHVPVISYGGMKAFSYLAFHGARGIQIESVWGNLAIIAKKLTGDKLVTDPSYGALHIALQPATKQLLVRLSYVGMLVGLGSMWWTTYRGVRATTDFRARFNFLVLGGLGLIFVTFVTAKVFSPQYVIWLLPFVCLVTGRSGNAIRWGTLLATLLTRIEFPELSDYVSSYSWIGTLAVLARNLVVIWLTWRTFRALREELAVVTAAAPEPEPALAVS
jgi:hypothetical protein